MNSSPAPDSIASHLDELEAHSVYLLREAFHHFEKVGLLWSMGKDSNVLLWLAHKAFCGRVPFAVIHIETTYEFPELLEFRRWAVQHYGLNLVVHVNKEALARGTGYETCDPVTVTHELKTVALQQLVAAHKFNAIITGIRRDEDATRAKERYFSPRSAALEWDYKDQPPEFWNQFTTEAGPGEHVRVQPLLDWTELDVWQYCEREQIPLPKIYFARDGQRYRSLGCRPFAQPVASRAATISEIIAELKATRTPERPCRTQGRAERNAMQNLRAKGFM